MGPGWNPLKIRFLLIFRLSLAVLFTLFLVETLLLLFNDRVFSDSFYIYDPELARISHSLCFSARKAGI